MTRRVGYGEDAFAGPWDAKLRYDETVIWAGTPRLGLAVDKGAFWAIVPATLGLLFLGFVILTDPDQADMLAVGPFSAQAVLVGFLIYLAGYFAFYAMTIPGLVRYALTTERAFIHRALPWPKLTDYDIGLTAPIDLREDAIYFADETVRHNETLRRRPIGFRNIAPAEAEAIHDMLREIQLKSIT